MRYLATVALAWMLAVHGNGAQKNPKVMPTFGGTLKVLDAGSIVLALDDEQVLAFRRTGKTRFVGVKQSALKPGDHVLVEAVPDIGGGLLAVNVRLDSAPGPPAAEPPREAAPPERPVAPPPEPTPKPVPEPKPVPPAKPEPAVKPAPPREAAGDPLAKARAELEALPVAPYTCRQVTSRFTSESRNLEWKPLDSTTVGVRQPFAATLRDLFSPLAAARFEYQKDETLAGRTAAVYKYEVDLENSRWLVQAESQRIEPAYRGAVWIDKETARVLRIRQEAVDLPTAFPLDRAETTVDYTDILPTSAEKLTCRRGTTRCHLERIELQNCRR
ncbi:MAG TPA: hypothetical protein VN442_03170 [Bryobacteraceae bacterium]|nr:hypothetical protein [Bryobacteraceae bacterium]